MWIYYIFVALLLSLSLLRYMRFISEKAFCIIVCISFILITGLRAYTVGLDTKNYYNLFIAFKHLPFADIFKNERDIGFYLLTWLIRHSLGSFTAFTLIIAVIFYIPLTLFIYRYSVDSTLSYLMLLAFGFFQFTMTGIRQTAAFGIMFLFLCELFRSKKRIVRLIILFLIGCSFHQSFFIILFYIPIILLSKRKYINYLFVPLIALFLIFSGPLLNNSLALLHSVGFDVESYKGSGAGITTLALFILFVALGLVCRAISKDRYKSVGYTADDELSGDIAATVPNEYTVIMMVATIIQIMVLFNSIFFRLTWYFSMIVIIYLPTLLKAFPLTKRSYYLVNSVTYVGVLLMYFLITMNSSGVVPYQFFWQVG